MVCRENERKIENLQILMMNHLGHILSFLYPFFCMLLMSNEILLMLNDALLREYVICFSLLYIYIHVFGLVHTFNSYISKNLN
jgi:hypothetical protein